MATNGGSEKKTENVRVWMDERLFVDLSKLALIDDRKLSEYIELVLRRHCYGQSSRAPPDGEVSERP